MFGTTNPADPGHTNASTDEPSHSVPEWFDTIEPGPLLTMALLDVELDQDQLSVQDHLRLVRARRRLIAYLEGLMRRDLVELANDLGDPGLAEHDTLTALRLMRARTR